MSEEGCPEVGLSDSNIAVTNAVIYSKNSLWKKACLPPVPKLKHQSEPSLKEKVAKVLSGICVPRIANTISYLESETF